MCRPLGLISSAVIDRLITDGPLPMAKLAEREQVHIKTLWWTMSRLVANGHVVVSDHRTVPWARRPVAIYAIPNNKNKNTLTHLPWGKHGRK